MLEQRVQGGRSLGFREDSEPYKSAMFPPGVNNVENLTLLDRAEFLGKVLIGRRSGHLFQRGLPAGQMFEPLVDLLG